MREASGERAVRPGSSKTRCAAESHRAAEGFMSHIAGFAAALPAAERHLRIDDGFSPEPMFAMAVRNGAIRSRAAPLR